MYLNENHFEKFLFYTILKKKKKLTGIDKVGVGFKTFEMKID